MNSSLLASALLWWTLCATIALLIAFAALSFARRGSAAKKELVWRITFGFLLLLPLTYFFRSQGLRSAPEAVEFAAGEAKAEGVLMSVASPGQPAMKQESSIPVATILMSVWFVGAVLLTLRIPLGLGFVWRLHRHAVPLADSRILMSANSVSRSFGMKCPMLMVTQKFTAPASSGRAVWLPHGIAEMPEDSIAAILRHEFAHIQRRDSFWRMLALWSVAVFWFHPLVWLAGRSMRRLQEQACDDAALTHGSTGPEYASLLCDFAKRWKSAPYSVLPMALSNELSGRITAILDGGIQRRAPKRWTRYSGAVMAVVALSFITLAQEAPLSKTPPAKSAVQSKAEAMILPQTAFDQATLEEVTAYLRVKSKELDRGAPKDKAGLNFILKMGKNSPKVTLNEKGKSIWEIASIAAKQSGFTITTTEAAIVIQHSPEEKWPNSAKTAELQKSPIWERASKITIPKIVFADVSIFEAVVFINLKAKELSPDKKGVPLMVSGDIGKANITFSLNNVPLTVLWQQLADLAGGKLELEKDAVVLEK